MTLFIFLITSLLLLLYIFLIIIYVRGWKGTALFIPQQSGPKTKVSIIVAARNEAKNITGLLEDLEQQDYPKDLMEVLIVDDYSEDETASIVLQQKNSHVRLICMTDISDNSWAVAYKKKAIAAGIRHSNGELIITTDADCRLKTDWISSIVNFYERFHPNMIVMPVKMTHQNRLIEIFQHLDFMFMQGITAASIQRKFTMMCNGANLAYTRKAYEAVKGFEDIDNLASGDDMMLMHKIASLGKDNIKYLKSDKVIVYTPAEKSLNGFLQQRIRWASKSTAYQDRSLLPILGLVWLFNVMLCCSFVVCFLKNANHYLLGFELHPIWVIGGILLIKTSIECLLLIPVARFFRSGLSLWLFPFLQPIHIFYIIVAAILGKTSSYAWKGRRVRNVSH